MKDLKSELVACLKAAGADIVGFAGEARLDATAKRLLPSAKTALGVACRVLRGSHRGVEEGTTYYQYSTTGVETIEETILPLALLKACAVLEDHGFSALPQRRNQLVMAEENSTNPEMDMNAIHRGCKAETTLDFERLAVQCGLGELGLSGTLLSDDFGPLQRYGFILTDAELEATPLQTPHLCDKCGKCVAACPGKALSADGKLDRWQCAAYYLGANMKKNPFMPPEAFADDPERLAIIAGEARLSPERAKEIIEQLMFYPPIKHGYVSSVCGKACDMACYSHLEEKGSLKRRFNSRFKKREDWKLDLLP